MQTPCKTCPWRADCKLPPEGNGAFKTEEMLGQAYGPFWLPCHSHYQGTVNKQEVLDKSSEIPQCAGAAIFRSNVNIDRLMPEKLLHLPEDRTLIFPNAASFVSYHLQMPMGIAVMYLRTNPVWKMTENEMNKKEVQPVPNPKQ